MSVLQRKITRPSALLCLVLAVLCNQGSFAQTQAPCLRFDDALIAAGENDPSLQIVRADLENAKANLQDAKSLRRPQLSVFARTGIGDNGLVDSQIENQIGLRASQRIIDFGDARLAQEASREEIRAQESLVLDAQGTAALEAGLNYISWLESEAQLRAINERVVFFNQQLVAVESLLAEGGSTLLERAEIAAEKASAESEQLEFEFRRDRAETQVQIASGQRLRLCQEAPSNQHRLGVSGPLAADALDQLIASAVKANPLLEALRRAHSGLRTSAKREARARLPIIDIVGITSYASEEFTGNFEFQNRVGLDVSVPIFSGSSLNARRRQATARAARSNGELATATRQLQEDISITYRRTILLESQKLGRQEILRLKTEEFKAASAEYDNGLRTLPALIGLRLELEDAALDEISARFDLERAYLRLSALTGNLLKPPGLYPIGQSSVTGP